MIFVSMIHGCACVNSQSFSNLEMINNSKKESMSPLHDAPLAIRRSTRALELWGHGMKSHKYQTDGRHGPWCFGFLGFWLTESRSWAKKSAPKAIRGLHWFRPAACQRRGPRFSSSAKGLSRGCFGRGLGQCLACLPRLKTLVRSAPWLAWDGSSLTQVA